MATFQNYATLSYNGVTRLSNVVTGEIVEALSMTKTAVVDTYTPGGTITYVLSIVNTRSTAYTNLTIQDDLGAYTFDDDTLTPLTYTEGSLTYLVDGALQTAPTATAGPPLTISGITVPAEGNVILIYEVTANQYAPLGEDDEITNTATITGCGQGTDVTATETVAPATELALTITKMAEPAVVTENGILTYTFVICNTSMAAADETDSVSFADTFDPVLENITVTLDGTTLETGSYNYDTTSGVFTISPGMLTVPAAVYEQNPDTGVWTITPGTTTLVISGEV